MAKPESGQGFVTTTLFVVTGSSSGQVWGVDLYTDDSELAVAAVHAGILRNGETGTVMVTILPGQDAYKGGLRNGVRSLAFGKYLGSYSVSVPSFGFGSEKSDPVDGREVPIPSEGAHAPASEWFPVGSRWTGNFSDDTGAGYPTTAEVVAIDKDTVVFEVPTVKGDARRRYSVLFSPDGRLQLVKNEGIGRIAGGRKSAKQMEDIEIYGVFDGETIKLAGQQRVKPSDGDAGRVVSFELVLHRAEIDRKKSEGGSQGRAADFVSPQLLVNPSCEEPFDGMDIAGWNASPKGAWIPRNEGPDPQSGKYYFFPGANEHAELWQSVSLSKYLGSIRKGGARVQFKCYLASWNRNDTLQVTIQALDSSGKILATCGSGARNCTQRWEEYCRRPAGPSGRLNFSRAFSRA